MRVLVVHAHPHPASYGAALYERVVSALRTSGAHIDTIDLWAEGFDPRLSAHEHRTHRIGLAERPTMAPHAELLRKADALVLVYPTWWGGPPAMLKGWLDRVLCEGVAYTLPEGADRIRPLLRNIRTLVVVTTYGSPRWVNALQGEPGRRTLRRGLRTLLSRRARTIWLGLYRMDTNTAEDRSRFLDEVARRLERLGS
ncbi:MAG: NAD(P)H-dependent oxidoreductase [Acidimicrobiales bacterium]|nr:NAD(P)H-dependent oxidoreductase [Acidimicrobiales bacterium]